MDTEQLASLRSPDRARYPELAGYSPEAIYEDVMGPGGLYLTARMTRVMNWRAEDIVLDLGCGKGITSLFLARHFGVRLFAVDLWTPASYLNDKFAQRGYRSQITPLNLDVRQRLPFADEYFDAIFCMNSFSFYGGSVEFLHHLLRHLKPGGQICIGGEVFNEEFTAEQLLDPPAVYNYNLPPPNEQVNVWQDDLIKEHSPGWWKKLFEDSGLVEVVSCDELDDAVILYEDQIRHEAEQGGDPDDLARSLAQLEYGYTNKPYKTLFVLATRKR